MPNFGRHIRACWHRRSTARASYPRSWRRAPVNPPSTPREPPSDRHPTIAEPPQRLVGWVRPVDAPRREAACRRRPARRLNTSALSYTLTTPVQPLLSPRSTPLQPLSNPCGTPMEPTSWHGNRSAYPRATHVQPPWRPWRTHLQPPCNPCATPVEPTSVDALASTPPSGDTLSQTCPHCGATARIRPV